MMNREISNNVLAALEKFRADVLAIGDMNAADFAKWQYVKMLIDEQKGQQA